MFRILFILAVFIVFSCTPQKKEKIEKDFVKSQTITGTTKIEFDEEMYDFGSLISGEIVIATFKFTNTANFNLVINEIKTDCGCITVNFSKEPVKPGNTGLIEIEFDSSGMFGKQFKSIEIHANTKELKHLAIFASVINEQLEIKY